jgi:stress-induced-phosphoprotein 1
MAEEAKAKGNEAFKLKNYDEAIGHYTDAIGHDASNHVFYSNRSACYCALKKYDEALKDGEKCIEVKPDFAKGYTRKGAALFGLGKLQEASAAYEAGLKVAPDDAALKKGLDEVRAEGSKKGANQIAAMFGSPEAKAKLAMHPSTAGFMKDPQFVQTLEMATANPQMFTMLMQQDQRLMACLQVILGGDMGGPPGGAAPPEPPKPKAEPKKEEPQKELSEEETAIEAKKAEAAVEKEAGTKAYKAKEFDTAIAHYTKAIEIYDGDMSYLTNRAACKFEQGNYEECIKDCQEALKVGKEHMADFKVKARAYARIGNSYVKVASKDGISEEDAQEAMTNAVDAYNKSLTEHRTDEVWTKLKKVQQHKKKRAELAYIDPEKAAEEKELGNADFKEGKWVDAMRHYSEAIKRDPNGESTHVYFSNRATCYIRMNEMQAAQEDLDACIKLCPTYAKAYLNKAHIYFAQKEFQKVTPLYESVIAMEGVDEDSKKKAQEGLQRTMHAIQSMHQGEGVSEEQLRRAQADPEIQAILADPSVQQVLRDFKENPKYAQDAMRNPGMAAKFQKLAAAGVIRMG